jgi:hypothetical protein
MKDARDIEAGGATSQVEQPTWGRLEWLKSGPSQVLLFIRGSDWGDGKKIWFLWRRGDFAPWVLQLAVTHISPVAFPQNKIIGHFLKNQLCWYVCMVSKKGENSLKVMVWGCGRPPMSAKPCRSEVGFLPAAGMLSKVGKCRIVQELY